MLQALFSNLFVIKRKFQKAYWDSIWMKSLSGIIEAVKGSTDGTLYFYSVPEEKETWMELADPRVRHD